MLIFLIAIVVGLVLLVKAADQFVVGAARLAFALRISAVVVGAIVIGFGTSAPELLVSSLASAQGLLGLAIGNIVGSNIANITLIAGAAALVSPLVLQSTTLRREVPLSFLGVLAFGVLLQGSFTRVEGIALLVLLAAAVGWIIHSARDDDVLGDEAQEFAGAEVSRRREGVRTALGLVGTIAGAQLLVYGASGVAREVGVSEGVIGLTLVAVGTSLPELVTALQAARRREADLIIGNLLGSNLFNSLGIAGLVAVIGPGTVRDAGITGTGVVLMIAAVALAGLAMVTGRTIHRREAIVLIAAYLVMVPVIAT